MNTPTGIVDLHVHSGPSILPRRSDDPETEKTVSAAGVSQFVLKAHEGSTAERAALLGAQVTGGIVLNSTVGGANADAVAVAARLGARVVWLPTISSIAHQAAATTQAELSVHRGGIRLRSVSVIETGTLAAGWDDVLDVVAEDDMILASGHVPVPETLQVFRLAYDRGARRFLVNHPMFRFMQWDSELVPDLKRLGVYLEVGCVADLEGAVTARLAKEYDSSLLVFGSDLGHVSYPSYCAGVEAWVSEVVPVLGEAVLDEIMASNGAGLLSR